MENIFIETISEDEFTNMKEEWNSLLEKSITNEVFLLWEWIYAWWDVFKDGRRELYILCGKNCKGEIIGIAPFYIEKRILLGSCTRNIIRFCSSVETYPDHLDVISKKEYEDSFPEALLKYLIQNDKDWDIIILDGVKENATIKRYLACNKGKLYDLLISCVPMSKCPYLIIDKTFEDYLKTFSGKKRYTLLKKIKILMKEENVTFKRVDCTEEPEKYINELFSLHSVRAKRKRIKTSFCGENIYKFHMNFINYLLKDDKIIIAFLYKESIPLVSYYCIKHNNKYYYYQTGLSYEGEKRSGGTVLFSLIIESAFREQYNEFDFLRGNEHYKYFWTKHYRRDYSMIIKKKNFTNRVGYYLSSIYYRAKGTSSEL